MTQIPGGILAERFGGKWVFGLAVVFTDLFCLLSPIAARSGGLPALIVVRIFNGLAEVYILFKNSIQIGNYSTIMLLLRALHGQP